MPGFSAATCSRDTKLPCTISTLYGVIDPGEPLGHVVESAAAAREHAGGERQGQA